MRYLLKANLLTWFETSNLTAGADTELEIYEDQDGNLTSTDQLLVSDDDSGEGLRAQLVTNTDKWLTIVIKNHGTGWGMITRYTFSITTKQEQTATPTITQVPTATNIPEATPIPSPIINTDEFEDDTPPNQPGYAGPQRHTFNPPGDID